MDPTDRDLDLVLLGATGFVGRLTAARLARHAPPGLRVALAGRSTHRLAEVRAQLAASAAGWPLVTVDVDDDAAVVDLARRTEVLVSTVGPYLRHGLPVVEACADAGTSYADLTGETIFVRRSIDRCHERAVATGARLVHACGFDSVPSDLGVGLAAALAATDGTGPLTRATLHVREARGGLSGGTIDSLRQQLVELRDDGAARRLVASQLALTEGSGRSGRVGRSGQGASRPGRDARDGRWHAPFAMGAFNGQIVQRSNELTDWAYGSDFSYTEVVDTGAGPLGAAAAAGVWVGSSALLGGLAWGPSRALLDRVLPKPGEGPSEQTRRRGRFRIEVEAETAGGARYTAAVAAAHDPGYDGTAVMLGESALLLAETVRDGRPGGVLTPMVALGAPLAERLRDRGFDVSVSRT